ARGEVRARGAGDPRASRRPRRHAPEGAATLRARGEVVPDHRGRLYGWPAPIGRAGRGAGAAVAGEPRDRGRPPRLRTEDGVSSSRASETFEIVNELGLHARAATRLVQLASRFEAEVELEKDGQTANGKSVMG